MNLSLKEAFGLRNFWNNFKIWLQKCMRGRYGADELGTFLIFMGLVFSLIGAFFPPLQVLSVIILFYCIYRMFSRNTQKRASENARFTGYIHKLRTSWKQFIARRKNSKEYKYVHCSKCHAILRFKRGQGEVKGKCPRCQTEYDIKC